MGMKGKIILLFIIIGVVFLIIGFQGEVSKELRTWALTGDRVWGSNNKKKIEAKFVNKKFGGRN